MSDQPKRPSQVSEYARVCLEALSTGGYGSYLSLGAAFGLKHYFEYRTTHDVDAWWVEPASVEKRQQVIHTLEAALRPYGLVRTRAWGNVMSVEVQQQNKTIFSFK